MLLPELARVQNLIPEQMSGRANIQSPQGLDKNVGQQHRGERGLVKRSDPRASAKIFQSKLYRGDTINNSTEKECWLQHTQKSSHWYPPNGKEIINNIHLALLPPCHRDDHDSLPHTFKKKSPLQIKNKIKSNPKKCIQRPPLCHRSVLWKNEGRNLLKNISLLYCDWHLTVLSGVLTWMNLNDKLPFISNRALFTIEQHDYFMERKKRKNQSFPSDPWGHPWPVTRLRPSLVNPCKSDGSNLQRRCLRHTFKFRDQLWDDAHITRSSDHLHVADIFNAMTDDFPTILGQGRPRRPPDYFLINNETKASGVLPLHLGLAALLP